MKHIKNMNELYSETYDRIAQTVSRRGDLKGDRLSQTANDLSMRNKSWEVDRLKKEKKEKFDKYPILKISIPDMFNDKIFDMKISDIIVNGDDNCNIKIDYRESSKELTEFQRGFLFDANKGELRRRLISLETAINDKQFLGIKAWSTTKWSKYD